MGTTQLLSVPYAFYAKTAANGITAAQIGAIAANTLKNSYPPADASKLAGIEAGAEVNKNADWTASSGDALILNKPTLTAVAISGSYNDLINKPIGNTPGDIQYWNGNAWVVVPAGQPGQFLQVTTSNIPAWSGATYPILTTTAASLITSTNATSGGTITNDGGASVTVRGVCWSTSVNPTIALSTKTTNGMGTGIFTSSITGLTPGVTYYVRAYATNSAGTAYGNEISFTTLSLTLIISLNSPNGFESWTAGTTKNITWTSGSVTDVKLEYTTDNGSSWTTIIASTATSVGTYAWLIPNTPSSQCLVRVSDASNASVNDVSNAVFTITSPVVEFQTITLNERQSYDFSTNSFGWVADGDFYVVSDMFWANNLGQKGLHDLGDLGNISLTEVSIPESGYIWGGVDIYVNHVYVALPREGEEGKFIIFRVITKTSSSVTITGFIKEQPGLEVTYITVISPNGGEEWSSGTEHKIIWTSTNIDKVNISYVIEGWNGWNLIKSDLNASDGSYTWMVPNTPSNKCRVEVNSSTYEKPAVDHSDNLFTISASATLPTFTTTTASGITQTTATSGGNITNDGGASVTARGVCWSTTTNPTIANSKTTDGTGTGSFVSNLTGLSPVTVYYVRAYATNSAGTAYGNEISFTTTQNIVVPTLTTTAASSIAQTTATSGGNITNDGGAAVTARGVCWSTTANPTTADSKTTDGTGLGTFTSSITGLTPGATYYLRAYATNSAGTAYGNEMSFTTQQGSGSTVTDIDGNVYNYVTIGTQVWMVENLKTTKYNDGEAILLVTDNTAWEALTTPGYCWYNNDAATYKATYGALYNWYTVNTGKLCPTGWHVPNDAEWHNLVLYLDASAVLDSYESVTAGGKLKETGTSHWSSPNTDATNSSGFTALPGGYRYVGSFHYVGSYGMWWSSTELTEFNIPLAWSRYMYYGNNYVGRAYGGGKQAGYSVRCLRN